MTLTVLGTRCTAGAQQLGCHDKFLVLQLQNLRTHQTGHVNPAGDGHGDNDSADAGRQDHHKQNHDDQVRHADQNLNDALHDGVHAAADHGGHSAVDNADEAQEGLGEYGTGNGEHDLNDDDADGVGNQVR